MLTVLSTNTSTGVAHDPFDPKNLVLSQNFVEMAGAKRLLMAVPVRKPNSQDFIRVHREPEYRMSPAAIIELKEDREVFLLDRAIAEVVPNECAPVTIFTAINRQGVLFLWPVKLPVTNVKKTNLWHGSAREAAEYAMNHWARVQSDMAAGHYVTTKGPDTIPDPIWPDLPLRELLRIAFRDRYIDSFEHPVLRRLQGID
jgi:hypothetical protein